MFDTPILFLIFNRPDLTRVSFGRLRELKPAKLFVAADGPRRTRLGETEICTATRNEVVNNIDWECDVQYLLRDENMGCKLAVSSAITWFFENVEEGIIIEDDIVPDLSFFSYCTELLLRYRDDQRVMAISGTNWLQKWQPNNDSYFSGLLGIWGWATWRRAWELYNIDMHGWSNNSRKAAIKNAIGSEGLYNFYLGMLEEAYAGTLDTWDVQWLYSILINRGLSLNPAVNLTRNIGFGNDATHTFNKSDPNATLYADKLSIPLKHPQYLLLDVSYLETLADFLLPKTSMNIKGRVLHYLKIARKRLLD